MRRIAATKLGIEFKRSASFQIPKNIIINGKIQNLYTPNENGVKVAIIELLLDDCYRCKKFAKSSQSINHILDIGANVGLFGIAARNAFPGAIIHAYEPNPNLEQYLKIQANSARFDYFMEAVGLEQGNVSLDYNIDSVQTRSSYHNEGGIKQIPFREAIYRIGSQVDMVKMDCEGAEWDILADIHSWRGVRNLVMEYHLWPDHSHDEARDVVQRLGFCILEFNPYSNYGLLIASRH